MTIVDSSDVFARMGYEYIERVDQAVEPKRTNIKFGDIAPELKSLWIASQELYRHQLEAVEALENGYCAILRSGAGSGKTEAWFFYFYRRFKENPNFRAMAIYPTLALANDQIKRISLYSEAINAKVLKLDALYRDELVKRLGSAGLRREISASNLIITNPAFLFHELKKILLNPSSTLYQFIKKLNLLVIDEFDFYSPRSIALMLATIDILSTIADERPQVAVLTATLANPADLCSFLEATTKRRCIVIDGEPFRVENRTYIVLGKNLYEVWSRIRSYKDYIESRGIEDRIVARALEDFETFKKNTYRVVQFLEALGLQAPSIAMDIGEILSSYTKDDGVTLVFTRSIARAEEINRMLKEYIGDAVASHHHLVSKRLREEIEERARRGEVKIIVSPRTLMQGIDIGTVVRVVHIGLPENVREFLQREGRKGRRREIPYTESVVIPSTRWDWELLSKGFEALEKWLSLPIEKAIVNPDNDYIKLFKALAKILSPWFKVGLSEEEHRVLKNVRVVRRDGSIDSERAKWIWERLNFYEFAPPYGIKRYLEDDGKIIPLEPVGHCDLVERFQVGCIDLSQDAIVTDINHGTSTKIVRGIVERPLRKFRIASHDAIAEAFEEYRYVKTLWGEEPSFLRDIVRGKLYSYVLAVVYPPRKGFGEYRKIPNRVMWRLISSRPRVVKIGDSFTVTYDRKVVYVPTETFGEYKDFTYGMIYDVDDREDSSLLRLGLALLMVVLRRVYGIPFETIMYSVEKIGEKKFFELHEPEAAGLLNTLKWNDIRKTLEEYRPDDLDLVLLSQLDDIAFSDIISLGIDLSVVKSASIRAVDYIMLKDRLPAVFRDRVFSIPKPSKALKILSLEAVTWMVDEDTPIPKVITGISIFDGEEVKGCSELYIRYPFTPPPKSLRDIESIIEDIVYYGDFKLVVYDVDSIVRELQRANLKRLIDIVRERAVGIRDELVGLGIDTPALSSILEEVKVRDLEVKPIDVVSLHSKLIGTANIGSIEELFKSVSQYIQNFAESRAKAIYILYLVTGAIKSQESSKQ
ncbi:MAG: helicase-related protein [Ignisphaera sp.]